MNPVYITDIAAFLPGAPVTNDRIEAVLGRIDNQPARVKLFVLQNNGIQSRHYAIDPETGEYTHTNARMTAEAVRTLSTTSGLAIEDIEGMACGTSSPDQLIPSHSNMVAGELHSAPSEIMSTAGVCVCGMTAMKYAWMNVALGLRKNFVSTGSERASPWMHKRAYDTMTDGAVKDVVSAPIVSFEKEFLRWMLSDGAGAALLEPAPREGRLNLRIDALDVRAWCGDKPVCMFNGMSRDETGTLKLWSEERNRMEVMRKGYLVLQQDARALEQHMVNTCIEGMKWAVKDHGVKIDEIDHFLPHLSSMYFKGRFSEALDANGMHVPDEKWFTNLAYKGNTGSASIYIILEELLHSGRLKKGQKIFCVVPESARFTMAGMLLTVV